MENKDDLIPVWFELEREFYVNLRRLADKHGISMADVLRGALSRFASESTPGLSPDALARKRWEKTSPEERRDYAKRLARHRWNKTEEE